MNHLPITIFFALSPALAAQGTQHWSVKPGPEGTLGSPMNASSISTAGDVDGDGIDDILVGLPDIFGYDKARVYSGATGYILHDVFNGSERDGLGSSISALGDIDGDGHDDFLVGAPGRYSSRGTAALYSGADGHKMFEFEGASDSNRLGAQVLGIADLDQDGLPDILVSEPNRSSGWLSTSGQVHIYSSASGQEIATWHAPSGTSQFGNKVVSVGDLDQDGQDDILISGIVPDIAGGYPYISHALTVYSTLSGLPLCSFQLKAHEYESLGAISATGDLDGDGTHDILVGVPYFASGGFSRRGAVYMFSGADGQLLRIKEGPNGNGRFGQSVIGGSDVDRDGIADYIVSRPDGAIPKLYVQSGRTDEVLHFIEGELDSRIGWVMSRAGDLDQDGHQEVIVNAPYADIPGLGAVGRLLMIDYD